jgi:hypothetical protein
MRIAIRPVLHLQQTQISPSAGSFENGPLPPWELPLWELPLWERPLWERTLCELTFRVALNRSIVSIYGSCTGSKVQLHLNHATKLLEYEPLIPFNRNES